MSRFVPSFCCLLVCAIPCPSAASAQSAWVGRWFYVPEASRRSPSSFTVTALPEGQLRYDAGWGAFILGPGGKPTPELVHPTTLVRTEMLTPLAFRYVELIAGRPVERVEERLSADGARLLGHVMSIGDDGEKSERDTVSLRIGAGRGLAGRWRELPSKHDTVRERSRRGAAHPYWIISQGASGVMRWNVVPSGEVLAGAVDGKRHPSAGPHREGQSFSIKVLSPHHLQFFIYEDGHLIEQTDDTLSRDGNRWTDLLWSPAHPDEKDLRWVYAIVRGLPDRRLTEAYLRRLAFKYGLTAGAYWAAFGLAFWNWRVGLIAAGIVTLSYIVPPAKPVFKASDDKGREYESNTAALAATRLIC